MDSGDSSKGLQNYKMDDGDGWQLEAVHEQFKVFDSVKTPYERIPSTDLTTVMKQVIIIKKFHENINTTSHSPRDISSEIIKHGDGGDGEIKLSFIVIVTNKRKNGKLCKIPVFVLICREQRQFLDMNLSLFKSWVSFMNNNDLPPCDYCFPFNGEYKVGGKLKIDFTQSAVAIYQDRNLFSKTMGFVVGVGVVASTFFFSIPAHVLNKVRSLFNLAKDFVPFIQRYGTMILRAVTLVQALRTGNCAIPEFLIEVWTLFRMVHDEFASDMSNIYRRVRQALSEVYRRIKIQVGHIFINASEWAQHLFVAVTHRLNRGIIAADLEAVEILESSLRNNQQSQTGIDPIVAIHTDVNSENHSEHVNTIFKNARNESTLQNGMDKNSLEYFHPITTDLLEIGIAVAKSLGKSNIIEGQTVFEALQTVLIEEFKQKVENYDKTLKASITAAGHSINIEAFNQGLGIEGDPIVHFWEEAFKSLRTTSLCSIQLKENITKLENQRKILIVELTKESEDDFAGLYRIVGVGGSGKFPAKDLIYALKDIKIELNDSKVVITETSTITMIREEELTIVAHQTLNSDNTSEGLLFVTRQ